jgi:hypothetical protein
MSMFEDDGNTKFYLDDEPVTVAEFNAFFYANDVGWSEEMKNGALRLTIFTDDAR